MKGGKERQRRRKRQRKQRGIVGYKIAEAASMLQISENAVRDMIKRGECPVTRVGRLLRVPAGPFHEKFGEAAPLALA